MPEVLPVGIKIPELKGFFFCLTGKMWTTREAIEKQIRSCNGYVVGTPRNKEIILVVADLGRDAAQATTKYAAAKRKGCKIISGAALQHVLEGDITIYSVLKMKDAPAPPPPTPVKPIDRAKHEKTVAKVLADLASFGK